VSAFAFPSKPLPGFSANQFVFKVPIVAPPPVFAVHVSDPGLGQTATIDYIQSISTAGATSIADCYFCHKAESLKTALLKSGSSGGLPVFTRYSDTWKTLNLYKPTPWTYNRLNPDLFLS
jgi:hypothetical protein